MTNALTSNAPTMAGAILDGVQRRVIPLTHAELMAINAECDRLRRTRAKPDKRRCNHTWRDLDKYTCQPVGRARGAFMGLYGLVLLMAAWLRG